MIQGSALRQLELRELEELSTRHLCDSLSLGAVQVCCTYTSTGVSVRVTGLGLLGYWIRVKVGG